MKLDLSLMGARHMQDCRHIDMHSYVEPWTAQDFAAIQCERNVVGVVAHHRGHIVGFVVFELYTNYARIVRLAVHPDWRRQGVGSRLVDRIAERLTQQRDHITCLVPETDDRAIGFLATNGFTARLERDAYDDGRDGYLFAWTEFDGAMLTNY